MAGKFSRKHGSGGQAAGTFPVDTHDAVLTMVLKGRRAEGAV